MHRIKIWVNNDKSEMKKILIFVNDADFFISHRLPIALAAKNLGYDVHIATAENTSGEKIRSFGLKWFGVPLSRSGANVFDEVISFISIYNLYKKIKPDIVHHVTIKPIIYGGIVSRILKIPAVVQAVPGLGYIFTANGVLANLRKWLFYHIYRIVFSHPNLIAIFQNPTDLEHFSRKKIVAKKCSELILGSGVDLKVFIPIPHKHTSVNILLPCRMLKDKGVIEFIEAAKLILKKYKYVSFILCGDIDIGNPSSIEKKQILKWEKENVATWLGMRTDMVAVLNMADIVCLPSYREGLPKVLIEAAACAKPIITTDVPGCRDVVNEGQNGLLVKSRDVEALVAAMEKLILNAELRKKMGLNSRLIAEQQFSVEMVVEKTLKIYNDLS